MSQSEICSEIGPDTSCQVRYSGNGTSSSATWAVAGSNSDKLSSIGLSTASRLTSVMYRTLRKNFWAWYAIELTLYKMTVGFSWNSSSSETLPEQAMQHFARWISS